MTVSDGLHIGGDELIVAAGPCAVESLARTRTIGRAAAAAGARLLRGGAFKPRTSPFSIQGLGVPGLDILQAVRAETGLPIVTECLGVRALDAVAAVADVIQIGMRNAQNYELLREVGALPQRPAVLLKCGAGMTLDELLQAADHLLAGGHTNVALCLRGHVGIGRETRGHLNLGDIPVLKRKTHLPVIVDPSHASGRADIVPAIAAGAIAAGAGGLIIEVHDEPALALSDGPQSLLPARFAELMTLLRAMAPLVGRRIADANAATGGLVTAGINNKTSIKSSTRGRDAAPQHGSFQEAIRP